MRKKFIGSVRFVGILLFLTAFTFVHAQSPFVTLWKTDNTGESGNNQIKIPANGEYNYSWEENSNPTNNGSGNAYGEHTITFPSAGVYKLSMTPTGSDPFNSIRFDDMGDSNKILAIQQWGDVVWSSFENAYWGAQNMIITATDIPNLTNVTVMRGAFRETGIGDVPNINNWDVSGVTDMTGMFYQALGFNSEIGSWDVGNVFTFEKMFFGAVGFNQPIGNWNMSHAFLLTSMFEGATNFNQPIGSWDVSQVEDMGYLFAFAQNFNQDISGWDTSSNSNFDGMFFSASNFNKPLNNWNTQNMSRTDYMFLGASSFNQPLDNWDVSNVYSMYGTFADAASFNQPLNNWNVSNVIDFGLMFQGAVSFDQPLDNWDVSSAMYMYDMFVNASAFDRSLASWTMTNLENPMFGDNAFTLRNSGVSCENYSDALRGWANNSQSPHGIKFTAGGLSYSPAAVVYRNKLINDFGWTISGDTVGGCSLGVDDTAAVSFSIHPNPATDFGMITGIKDIKTIQLYDLTGKLIQNHNVQGESFRIDLSGLAPGVYVVKVSNSNGKVNSQKLIRK